MKYIKMRFNRYHDKDFIILKNNEDFNLRKKIYLALKAYLNNDKQFKIILPNYQRMNEEDLKTECYYIPINDENKDIDIAEWYENIPYGDKLHIIKGICRYYYDRPFDFGYPNKNFSKTNNQKSNHDNNNINQNQRPAPNNNNNNQKNENTRNKNNNNPERRKIEYTENVAAQQNNRNNIQNNNRGNNQNNKQNNKQGFYQNNKNNAQNNNQNNAQKSNKSLDDDILKMMEGHNY